MIICLRLTKVTLKQRDPRDNAALNSISPSCFRDAAYATVQNRLESAFLNIALISHPFSHSLSVAREYTVIPCLNNSYTLPRSPPGEENPPDAATLARKIEMQTLYV